MKHPIILRIYT